MADEESRRRARHLRDRGWAVVPSILPADLLCRLRHRFDFDALGRVQVPLGQLAESGAFMPLDLADELTVQALTWPGTWRVLVGLGWPHPKLHSCYLSTKQPGAQALPWHSDVYYPAPGPIPPELLLLLSLHDTTPANGCLRVVPGSHRATDAVAAARHTREPASAEARAGEVDVPVHAGDLVITDRRLLHATHPNRTGRWRTCLTIAVAPAFDTLPEPVQARIVTNPCLPPRSCQDAATVDPRLHPLLPRYDGHAEPVAIA